LSDEICPKEKPTNSLEELLEREKREKTAELERLKIERMVEEERKRLEELKSGRKPKETEEKELGLEDLGLSINTVRELAKLPDDERNRVIQTWAMIKSADKVQSGILLPLLIGFAKANPGASQNNLVEFAKVMADQIKTGMEMAKETKSSAPTYDPVKLIETMGTIWAVYSWMISYINVQRR